MSDVKGNPPLRSFGGYEIEGELGRGGMGVVYLARQIELNRHVALKMLTGHYGPNELKRFLAEAETAAGLHHANIAHIYEVGEHEGAPFYSMEYVRAGSLADRIRKDLPSPQDTAQLLMSVARALHFAHQNGVVHRDMKPANVLLDSDGVPKVADFGIAKRLKDDSKLTQTGAVIGTPTYMAPEQAKGTSRHVGPAADVYSLGTILYEMLAGRPPFLPEDSETAITVRVFTEDPVSPAFYRPEIPRDLETICMKCIEKEPRARYASAADLAEDLRRFLDDESILARPPNALMRGAKWIRRHPWKSVAGLLVVMVALVAVARLRQWILYERPRIEYAATIKSVNGATEAGVSLTPDEVARREVSFRLTRAGTRGPIVRVEAVNPRGHPATVREVFNYDALPSWFEGIAGMQNVEARFRETAAIETAFSNGEAAEAIALDRNHNAISRVRYDYSQAGSSRQLVRAQFMNLRGYDIGQASHAEFERDGAGYDARVRFYSSSGQPKPNGEGVYGYSIERDAEGRPGRLINLGSDGNPAVNRLDVGGFAYSYNSRGWISRIVYLGVDGKPALFNGFAAATFEYDPAGNVTRVSYLDLRDQPVNSADGIVAVDYKRNQGGETNEIIAQRLKTDGQFETTGRTVIEYDGNGYPSDVRTIGEANQRRQLTHDPVGNITEERYVDGDGKPQSGPKGWSIRRKTYGLTKDPPGWREEETYFDVNGGKAFEASGHHRAIVEFDPVGQLRLLVNEDQDPKRFGYYRFVSKPEFYAGGKLRRVTSRFEDLEGNLASGAGLRCTSAETLYDEDAHEVTYWERGCDIDAMGAPAFRTDTQWYTTGARKHRVRQAYDENGNALAAVSYGGAHIEHDFDDHGQLEHSFETGFDEKLAGFSTREARFTAGKVQTVTHKRNDGTVITVGVYIKSINPEQPKASELRAGDQVLSANGVKATNIYAWSSLFGGEFPGGWIEVEREGKRIRLDGFQRGKLGVVLEDRAV